MRMMLLMLICGGQITDFEGTGSGSCFGA
jgi:hypothetical protein